MNTRRIQATMVAAATAAVLAAPLVTPAVTFAAEPTSMTCDLGHGLGLVADGVASNGGEVTIDCLTYRCVDSTFGGTIQPEIWWLGPSGSRLGVITPFGPSHGVNATLGLPNMPNSSVVERNLRVAVPDGLRGTPGLGFEIHGRITSQPPPKLDEVLKPAAAIGGVIRGLLGGL